MYVGVCMRQFSTQNTTDQWPYKGKEKPEQPKHRKMSENETKDCKNISS